MTFLYPIFVLQLVEDQRPWTLDKTSRDALEQVKELAGQIFGSHSVRGNRKKEKFALSLLELVEVFNKK